MSSFPNNNALRVHGIRHAAPDDDADRPVLDMPDLNSRYSPFSQPDSPTAEDDENASLRSQALNADGTPKRPMNAFMIFARRRRPQVSAANQMMRTGEISKILSKEWNTMPMSDKQFYLDQAKKLKENFNAKYPDYVYRRRPNNSRKKRRTDASTRGVDAYGDPREDSLSPHEHSPDYHSASVSPIDGLVPNEHSVTLASQQYRIGANPYSTSHSGSHHFHHGSETGYPYYSQSQGHHSHHSHHAHRLPHPASWSSHDTSPSSATSALSPILSGSLGLHSSISYPSHSPSIYHPDDDAHGSGLWAAGYPRLDQPVKLEPPHPHHSSSWGHGNSGTASAPLSLSARRGSLQPPPLLSHALSRGSEPYSHGRNWSESTGTGTASPSSSSSGTFPPFQTLTAPFYPSSGTVSPSTASSSSAASHSSYFGPVGAAQSQSQAQQQQQQQSQDRDSASSAYDPNSPTYATHAQAQQAQSGTASMGLQQPRAYTGPTLGSTLALSPANAAPAQGGSLWSSVRTKSEL